jgi:hypothetical protein
MKLKLVAAFLILSAASAAHAQTPAFSYCGTYGAYVMLYKNTDQFEELGKLRCGEKVEVLGKWFDYLQIRTLDGKVGWARSVDVTGGPSASPTATPFGLTNSPVQPQHDVVVPLSNKDILSMQGMRLSPEVIIAKIKSSPTSFDTSAAALQKLKYAGVPDKVIVAMVQAPAAPVSAAITEAPKAPEFLQVKIPDGTPVELEMIASVSSDAVREGTIIHLKVSKDVAINGVNVFKKDSEARARVYVITQPAFMGKPGEISWAMEDITAVTGDQLPATFAAQETSSAAPTTTSVEDTGTAWEFRKNKPTTMPAGHHLRATIHGDIVLRIPPAFAAQSRTDSDLTAASSQNVEPLPEVSSARPARTNPR